MYEPDRDTADTETAVEFDERLDEIDDFDDRIVIERTSDDEQPQPGRRARDEQPRYLSPPADALERFTGDADPDSCGECGSGIADGSSTSSLGEDLLIPLTPIQRLGYNMHCRACGGLLTQLRHAPVEGLVFLEEEIEVPDE